MISSNLIEDGFGGIHLPPTDFTEVMNQSQFRYQAYYTNIYVKNELHHKEVRTLDGIF